MPSENMTYGPADIEKAERLGRKRARIFAFQAILFISWQGMFIREAGHGGIPGGLRLSAWLLWSVALLFLLASGGMLYRARKVRPLLDDELSRSHRMKSQVAGFWAAAGTSLVLYVIQMVEPMTASTAIHIILSFAIAAALLTFSLLERQARTDAG